MKLEIIENPSEIKDEVKPFLRWAGGKSWLLKHLGESFNPNSNFENYHEPFLGGGSVFFHFQPAGKAYLSDLNEELIETYSTLVERVEDVIVELRKFKNTKPYYYKIRETNFISDAKKAAKFIYLNQTSFNGIYRVNLDGKYNVPYGFRSKDFFEPDNLRVISKLLNNSILRSCDFNVAIKKVKKNDFVFLDPPYTVSHNNNGFIKYNQKLFSLNDQYRLSDSIDYIKKVGAYYILMNAAHRKITEIFEKGDNKKILSRANLIGGRNAQRGHISEYMFTNICN